MFTYSQSSFTTSGLYHGRDLAHPNLGLDPIGGVQSHKQVDSLCKAGMHRERRTGRKVQPWRRCATGCKDCTIPVRHLSSAPDRLVQFHLILASHSPPFLVTVFHALAQTSEAFPTTGAPHFWGELPLCLGLEDLSHPPCPLPSPQRGGKGVPAAGGWG